MTLPYIIVGACLLAYLILGLAAAVGDLDREVADSLAQARRDLSGSGPGRDMMASRE